MPCSSSSCDSGQLAKNPPSSSRPPSYAGIPPVVAPAPAPAPPHDDVEDESLTISPVFSSCPFLPRCAGSPPNSRKLPSLCNSDVIFVNWASLPADSAMPSPADPAMPCSSSSCDSPWASLSADLLELLVESQMSFFDRIRFGAVCKSWRAAARFERNPVRRCGVGPSLPILTFRDPKDEGRGGEAEADEDEVAAPITRCFYSLSDDKVYRLKAPCESRDWHFLGSSHGWLAMVDLCAKPFLFNPISGARVDLPSLATLTRIIRGERKEQDGTTVYIYYDPFDEESEPYPFTGKDMRDHFTFKLVLSSSPLDPNCVAMATVTGYRLLAYTRPGDDTWIEVSTELMCFQDIIYHDRRFYALAYTGETISIDFKDSRSPIVEVFAPKHCPLCTLQLRMYLVALPSGEIIQVVKYVDSPENIDAYETEAFEIYKLQDGSKGKEWVEVDCIGDYCLFLGFNHSMSLPASEVLGKYRANCIYFTDDNVECYFRKDYGGLDFGIYDFEEEEIERFCHMDVQRVVPPPMWITPSI